MPKTPKEEAASGSGITEGRRRLTIEQQRELAGAHDDFRRALADEPDPTTRDAIARALAAQRRGAASGGGAIARSVAGRAEPESPISAEELRTLEASTKDSVVLILNKSYKMDISKPGKKTTAGLSRGSGAIINVDSDTNTVRIITNHHVVRFADTLKVKYSNSPREVKAKVVYQDRNSDLAIIEVQNRGFATRAKPLDFAAEDGAITDDIYAVGYPMGGDTITTVKGSISAIESTTYANSGVKLPIARTDAPTNHGNSGGPVLDSDHNVVGLTHQGMERGNNICYFIPMTVINRFMEAARIKAPAIYPDLHIDLQEDMRLINAHFREFFGLTDEHDGLGIFVNGVPPLSAAKDRLKPKDILLGVDGFELTLKSELRVKEAPKEGEPTELNKYARNLKTYIYSKNIGDTITFEVLRGKALIEVPVVLSRTVSELDLITIKDDDPSFYINNGVKFYELSTSLMRCMDRGVTIPIKLMSQMHQGKSDLEKQIVLLTGTFDNEDEEGATFGYPKGMRVVHKVNDVEIKNLLHLAEVMEAAEGATIRISFVSEEDDDFIVIPNIPKAELQAKMYEHYLNRRFSPDVEAHLEKLARESAVASAREEAGESVAATGAGEPVTRLAEVRAERDTAEARDAAETDVEVAESCEELAKKAIASSPTA